MRLALYQPEIAQNTGTLLRLAACMKVGVDIIGPCGFAFSDRQLKRSGMDYLDHVDKTLYDGWNDYKKTAHGRLILLDTKATTSYTAFQFLPGDSLMVGTESQGVPDFVYQETDHQVLIPMHPPLRSLNVAISAAMVLGEALRQTGGFYADSL
jgi:tRNA (cytidine/uridine-2'-O-)-methyltransferase